ncbi:MAG: bile acid:sodium symporter [Micrococcales bacterium]|nr:bile acid:sodium symporter [Micrococcales bacterium]
MTSSPAARRDRRWGVDPLTGLVLVALVAGLVVPVRGAGADVGRWAVTAAVVLLFFGYGVRTSRAELRDAVRAWRLQVSVLVATFVVFPVLGVGAHLVPGLGDLSGGVLYLALLPSTVQSSVVLTSIAQGNVPGAITAATASNIIGIVATPVLVMLSGSVLMGRAGSGLGPGALVGVLTHLVLPFTVGQVAQRWWGPWLKGHSRVTKVTDRGTVVLVVYVSVSEATVSGAWTRLTPGHLAVLLAVCAVLLAVMLLVTWHGGAWLGLPRADRITLLMCGSKKSLATGLPMASVLFVPAVAASVALPVIVFHQLQLAVCAVLARRLSDG